MRDAVAEAATRVTRQRARSFYLASLFLPRRVRRDVHVMYAYYRTIDDLVDEPPAGWSRAQIERELDRWESAIRRERPADIPLQAEIVRLMDLYGVPDHYLTMVIDGARLDLTHSPMETMEDVIRYSLLVAGSVGLVMAHVLGATDEGALDAARNLGIAMQLTNILRDVAEDLNLGRLYLPSETLFACGCSPDILRQRRLTPELQRVLCEVATEARARYGAASSGIVTLPSDVRFSISLAATLYARILDKLERQNYDVFAGRAHLSAVEKWALAMPIYLQHRVAVWR
jgi:phytoene synthase